MKQKILLLMMVMLAVWNMDAAATEITVLQGPINVGWSITAIPTAYVQRFKAGDKLTVYVSGNTENATSASFALRHKPSSGDATNILERTYTSNSSAEATVTFPYEKSVYLTQDNIDLIKINYSLGLWGSGTIVSSVTWTKFDGVLWSGTQQLGWSTLCQPDANIVKTIKAGDKLTVTIDSKVENQTNLQCYIRCANYTGGSTSSKNDLAGGSIASNSTFPYTLECIVTSDMATALQTNGSLYLNGCNLNVTSFTLTRSEDLPQVKDITLSTTETRIGDNWNNDEETKATPGYLRLTGEELALAAVGDQIAIHVSAISSTSDTHTAWLQNGSFQNFDGVSGVSITSASDVATFTLTEAMVNAIHGNVEGVNDGLVIKGSAYTFNEVHLLHTVVKTKGTPATNLWTGSEVISWTSGSSNNVILPASSFALAEEGMKLRMSFSGLQLSAQGRIVQGDTWAAFTDADSYETLKTSWGNYYEFDITSTMLTELQANGLIVSGIGYTLTSIDLIDPDCEYDVLATFDTDDIKAWELSDGTPNLTVTLQNFEAEEVTVPINIALMTDMFQDFNTYAASVTLAAGETKTTDVEFSNLTPGFYRMAANVAGNKLCTYYIGYDPTSIVSPNDAQDDFWAFWDEGKAELAAIPILDGTANTYVTLQSDLSTGARYIYKVKIQGVPDRNVSTDPVYVYGYLAVPKAEGTYPCLINFHGTDNGGNNAQPSIPGTDSNTGWCEFNISMPGQYLSRIEEGNTQYIPSGSSTADFYAYGLGDNLKHYYRMAYLDCVRAVDFVLTQEKVDKNNIFAAGGSQGGCLTYVCAGLNAGRIRGIAPSITGHADFVHTMEIVGWPTNVFNNWINTNYPTDYATGKEALLRHQSYFDTKNFASRITCPVITNFSLQDNTDGPHLNIAPYNLLINVAADDKEYSINQFKGHSAKDGWSTEYMAFFTSYINKEPVNVSAAEYGTYYNSTAVQLPAGVQAATIDGASNGTLTINWRYDGDTENNVIPGGTAVMLKSTAGNYKFTLLPSNTTAAPDGNLLHGSDVATTTTGGDVYYKLALGSSTANNGVLGWYWGAADGAAFTIEGHKAWLALTTAQANAAPFFSLEGGDTTGIGATLTDNGETLNDNVIYDLQGRRVSKIVRGIYIVNGKKTFIK